MTDKQILRHLKKKTLTEVAELSGKSKTSVYRIFKTAYPLENLQKSRLPKEYVLEKTGKGIGRIKEMGKLRKKGLSLAEIGTLQNPPISRQRVSQLLRVLSRN